jgi:hypothetical protein
VLVALKECSTRWNLAGTGNCGGPGANALEARKIEAQTAQ